MRPENHTARSGAHYLVVVGDCVVLQDLSDTVAEFDTGATVIAVNRASDALLAIAKVPEIVVAFIEAAPDDFACTRLCAAIHARRGRMIFLGDEAEEACASVRTPILHRPFSSEIVFRRLGLVLRG
ncbi:hypothetical protein [Frigidibacter sp. SD6-1]|uniref:hypothetical protein n=1 Tax=Frigidibacter sp. SD6-1 TaxID=3032581 RepID=UPI0024DF7ADD|nr:hypothetical protein [Frigidibacter sp. SD6-1]